MSDLADLYRKQGRYAEAEPLMKQALGIVERAQGPNHSDVATLLDHLCQLLILMDRVDEAEPLRVRELAIMTKAYREGTSEDRDGSGKPWRFCT